MKKSTAILIWGGITAIACAIHKAILVMQGISLSGWAYLNFLLFFIGLFIGIKQVKDKVNGGYLNFGEGYLVSLLITAIVTVVGLIGICITLHIMPDLGDRLLAEVQIQLVNSGLSEDKIDAIMKIYTPSFTPGRLIVNSIFGNIIIGALLGLIAAGVNTHKRPMFEEATEVPTIETNTNNAQ